MEQLIGDVRLGFRRLRQRPGFTFAAAAALALGIGSTTAIYSVVQAVVLRPLPFADSAALVMVWEEQPAVPDASIAPPDFRDWKAQAKTIELSAFTGNGFNLTGRDRPERINGVSTDADFFRLLRPQIALGRAYGPGSSSEVVLSDAVWRRVFGGDPAIIGKSLTLNGQSHLVVGVLGKDPTIPALAELWATPPPGQDLPSLVGQSAAALTMRGNHYLRAIGRLRPGASLASARAELEGIGRRLEASYPDQKGHRPVVDSLQEVIVGPAGASIWLLFGGVVLVLLIACANVAGLQLAQAASRQREIATRLALGATRFQLVRQLLAESVLLSLFGGALGLILSHWGVDALVALAGRGLPRAAEVSIDWSVLAFTGGVSVISGGLGGLAPALLASRGGTLSSLKDASPAGFGRARLRSALIVAEVALAIVLLAGAGLLARSFLALRAVPPGFATDGVLTARLSRPTATPDQIVAFYEEVLRRASALPGVTAAGAIVNLPFSGSNSNTDISVEGLGKAAESDRRITEIQIVAGDYFQALSIPLAHGRFFTAADGRKGAPRVAIANRAMADRYWKGQDPIGKRFSMSNDGGPDDKGWIEVVGVVGDVRQFALNQPSRPEAYFPLAQVPTPQLQLAIKAVGDAGAVSAGLRKEVAAIDPESPVWNLSPLEELLGASLRARRASTLLLGIFSGLALLLSVLGIYAMMAYAVVQRTREIGVRMALGAEASGVVLLVIRQGMRLSLLGVGIGLPAAFALSHLIGSQLYGVGVADVPTYLGTAALLTAAALVACWIPATVAARVSPVVALKAE